MEVICNRVCQKLAILGASTEFEFWVFLNSNLMDSDVDHNGNVKKIQPML